MRMRRTIDLATTPERLWPWLTEQERLRQWMKGLVEITPKSEGDVGVGYRSTLKIKEGRKISEYDEEITAWSPPHSLAVKISGGCMPTSMSMRTSYVVSATANGARVEAETRTEGGSFLLKILSPLMRLFAGAQQKAFFRTLKTLVEAEAA